MLRNCDFCKSADKLSYRLHLIIPAFYLKANWGLRSLDESISTATCIMLVSGRAKFKGIYDLPQGNDVVGLSNACFMEFWGSGNFRLLFFK